MAIWGIIFFVLSGYFSSLFSILFSFAYGHYVFLRITNLPFVNLVLFASILYFILNINKYKYIALGLGVIVLGKLSYQCGKELQLRQETHAYYANKRDLLYYKKIIAASDTLGQRGVFMLSERKLDDSNIGEEYDISYLQTDYWERLNPSVFYLGQILNYYKPHVTVSVLSETPYYEPATASNSNPQDFAPYQYYSIYKRTHAFPDSTRESAKQVSFIRDIGASFMFASKWADVPPEILYLVKDSAIDRISGERFYIFNTLPHQ
jgi:hypothetical protein